MCEAVHDASQLLLVTLLCMPFLLANGQSPEEPPFSRNLLPNYGLPNSAQSITVRRRSHKDLAKDAAPYYRKARKFYDGIAHQLTTQGHSLDV